MYVPVHVCADRFFFFSQFVKRTNEPNERANKRTSEHQNTSEPTRKHSSKCWPRQTKPSTNNDHKMNGWMDGWMSVTNDDDDDANKKNDRRKNAENTQQKGTTTAAVHSPHRLASWETGRQTRQVLIDYEQTYCRSIVLSLISYL